MLWEYLIEFFNWNFIARNVLLSLVEGCIARNQTVFKLQTGVFDVLLLHLHPLHRIMFGLFCRLLENYTLLHDRKRLRNFLHFCYDFWWSVISFRKRHGWCLFSWLWFFNCRLGLHRPQFLHESWQVTHLFLQLTDICLFFMKLFLKNDHFLFISLLFELFIFCYLLHETLLYLFVFSMDRFEFVFGIF